MINEAACGSMKAASLSTVCCRVNEAWRVLLQERVSYSFNKYGISNAIDRTEDDILWDNKEEETVVV